MFTGPAGCGSRAAAKTTASDAELDAKLQHSYAQSVAGEGRPVGDVFDDPERSTS